MKKSTKLFIGGIALIAFSFMCASLFDSSSESLKVWYFMFGMFTGLAGILTIVGSFIEME